MTPNQLKEAKGSIKRFYHTLQPFIDYFSKNQPHYVMIGVLVQNAQFVTTACEGHNHEEEVKKLYKIEKLLHSLAKYYDSYFEKWVYDEVSACIMFADMED